MGAPGEKGKAFTQRKTVRQRLRARS
jgi:hypothetical protein